MEFKQLQFFLTAAETLSFTEAAQRCFTVQSAISQQIAALEKELGVPLFLREKRLLKLTPEGEVFRKEAQTILVQLSHARQSVQSVSQGFAESLHIGRQGDLMRELLPPVLRRLRAEKPSLRLQFKRGNTQELLNALENCEIDCMLSVFFPEHRLYEWLDYRVIRREPIRIMIAADHPLAARSGKVHMAELSRLPMILLSGSDKKNRLAAMAEAGYSDSMYSYVDSQNSIEQLVAAGLGISALAACACRPHPDIAYLDLQDPPQVELTVSWNKSRLPETLEHFISILTEQNR